MGELWVRVAARDGMDTVFESRLGGAGPPAVDGSAGLAARNLAASPPARDACAHERCNESHMRGTDLAKDGAEHGAWHAASNAKDDQVVAPTVAQGDTQESATCLLGPGVRIGRPSGASLVFRSSRTRLFNRDEVLHVGVTDMAATRVYNFDVAGCTVNDANAAEWSRAVSIGLCSNVCTGTAWDDAVRQHHAEWSAAADVRYDATKLNCYDYVVSLANTLRVGGHAAWTRRSLCGAGVDGVLRAVQMHDELLSRVRASGGVLYHATVLGKCRFSVEPRARTSLLSGESIDTDDCAVCVAHSTVVSSLEVWDSVTHAQESTALDSSAGEWELEQGQWES
eukprot:m.29042 g.29042  ORF g.29042 m.29042 type:complete len:339 (-) comp12077_c0_seq1:912-1928(-)